MRFAFKLCKNVLIVPPAKNISASCLHVAGTDRIEHSLRSTRQCYGSIFAPITPITPRERIYPNAAPAGILEKTEDKQFLERWMHGKVQYGFAAVIIEYVGANPPLKSGSGLC